MSIRLIAALIALVGATSVRAGTIALTFTGGTPLGSGFTRGWSFSTSADITVTSLGWWDENGDGLGASHQVGIWNIVGNLLMSATVASGTTDPLQSGFRFNSTLSGTPALAAGIYIIGGLGTGDSLGFNVPGGNLTLAPQVSFIQNQVNAAAAFSFPNLTQGSIDAAAFGPTFEFDVAAVPEPSTIVLFGLGALALGAVRLRRKPS